MIIRYNFGAVETGERTSPTLRWASLFSCFSSKCDGTTFSDLRRHLEEVSGYASDVRFYESDPWWEMDDEEQVEYSTASRHSAGFGFLGKFI